MVQPIDQVGVAAANVVSGIVLALLGFGCARSFDRLRGLVNSVAPGPVWTPLIPATLPEHKVESFGGQAPMGRSAQPAELAPAFVFLASSESSYVTGEVIAVTGGSPIN